MKTAIPSPADIERHWHLIDADGLVLGGYCLTGVSSAAREKDGIVHLAYPGPKTDSGGGVTGWFPDLSKR